MSIRLSFLIEQFMRHINTLNWWVSQPVRGSETNVSDQYSRSLSPVRGKGPAFCLRYPYLVRSSRLSFGINPAN